MVFENLKLSESLLRAVREQEYETATPIQTAAIPHVLAGRDILGCAQTGTGKTAAFALPTLQRLADQRPAQGRRVIRALVLAPTRELASQITDSFRTYGRHTGLRQAVIFGGVSQHSQVKSLRDGVDILVATPGRLLDLMNQGFVELRHVEILVLDESDQMLDMGFIHDLKRIVTRVPSERQTLMFSATMPTEIRRLAGEWLRNPIDVSVAPQATPVETVRQSVYFVDRPAKSKMLLQYLRDERAERTIVFTRTKHGADKLARILNRSGVKAEAIHGNKSQNARQQALLQFKSKRPPVLVATDVAARGLDIDEVSHVVNYDLPMTPEIYVHRIGRTGRAGAAGIATCFCDREERSLLRDIERLTRQKLTVAKSEHSSDSEPVVAASPAKHDSQPHRRFARPGNPAARGKRFFGKPRRNARAGSSARKSFSAV